MGFGSLKENSRTRIHFSSSYFSGSLSPQFCDERERATWSNGVGIHSAFCFICDLGRAPDGHFPHLENVNRDVCVTSTVVSWCPWGTGPGAPWVPVPADALTPLWKMVWYWCITCAHPPVYFKSSLDYLWYWVQYKCYVNCCTWQIQVLIFGTFWNVFSKYFWSVVGWIHRCETCGYIGLTMLCFSQIFFLYFTSRSSFHCSYAFPSKLFTSSSFSTFDFFLFFFHLYY